MLVIHAHVVKLIASHYVPAVIGFFGLGTGLLIWGGVDLFGIPPAGEDTSKALVLWAVFIPGLVQFIVGLVLIIGLTWLNVFGYAKPLFFASLAFLLFGLQWIVVGLGTLKGAAIVPDGWMAIPYALLSILGLIIFANVSDIPVMLVFVGLTLIHLNMIPTRFGIFKQGQKVGGVIELLLGLWIMYLTYAIILDKVLNYKLWM